MKINILINDKEVLTLGRKSKVKRKKSRHGMEIRKGTYHMKDGKYSALDIAKYIVNYGKENDEITNLKLQKLLYFIEAKFMKENSGESLFYDQLEAWDYGPVVKEVYSYYKGNGNRPISVAFNYPPEVEIIPKDGNFIEEVVNHFRNTDQWDLVDRTHKEDPWKIYYKPGIKPVIPKKAVRDYYRYIDVLTGVQT